MSPFAKTTAAALVAVAAAGAGYVWYVGGGFAALGRPFGFGQAQRPERSPPLVVLAEAGRETVTRIVEAVGNTIAAESVTLTAEVAGRIVEIGFTDGQTVAKGAMLVRLDRQIAETELADVEAEAKRIEQELERAEFLLSRGSGPRATVEDTQRRLQAARSRVDGARERLDHTVVRAPFTGRVGLRDISVGAVVERTTTLAIVDSVSPMDLRFTVPEQNLGRIKAGIPVRATSSAFEGRTFEGEVKATASRVDPASRTISIEARLANEDGALLPGMLMNVAVTVETVEDAVVIPPIALLVRGSELFVYVLGGESKVERRSVKVGQREPGRIHVVDGLKPGERIIVEGVQNVTEGQPVRVKEPGQEKGDDSLAEKGRPRPATGG